MFEIEEKHLERMCAVNHFARPDSTMVIFGIRGCLPIAEDDQTFQAAHQVELATIDHVHPRCTLGQWRPGDGFAVFPGSTVPHRRNVGRSLNAGGSGTNQLLTGHYRGYKKGRHPRSKPRTRHEALRNDGRLPIRRTADDLDYDNDDRVEYTTPCDNLHAAWCGSVDDARFASAGCQVVVGFPHCPDGAANPASGPWRSFQENVYELAQGSFDYLLVTGRELRRVVRGGDRLISSRLRFGSRGALVTELQNRLQALGHYEGEIDDDFGRRTLFAVLSFQEEAFGHDADDGIVGPNTASALQMDWPNA